VNVHLPNPSEFRVAARVARIGVSEILKITATANAARAQGRDVIVLGAGEPDFDTPDYIKQAAMEAIRRGETKYTVLDGSNEMKLAIQAKFQRENGLRFELNEISVSAGAKQVLFNALMASLDPGDEVIVAAPYWTTYVDMISICGGKAVVVETSEQNGFRLTPESLERAITPKTRWLLLNSPSNPSGSAYSADELRDLTDVVARHRHVWIMADDIYEHIIYDRSSFATPRKVAPDLADRILTINGVSKAYAMTGWRLGYGAGPKSLIEAMAVVQSQSTSCPSSVSQAAATAALMHPHAVVRDRCLEFQARRDRLVSALNGVDGLSFRRPEGAFYAFVNCAGLIGRKTAQGDIIKSDVDYCRFLIERVGVAVVPGSCFGLAPYVRLSYATSSAVLEDACGRLAHASTLLVR
jgi:aspartate aminotransferase